jgi:lipid II:glycine glycyltransferase (peptidoglycan interpeptide bridge formation enzyme)
MEEKEIDFLQSDYWRGFQENVGHRTFFLKEESFRASIIEHELPIVGKYFYIPRGPIMEHGTWNMEQKNGFDKLFNLAKENRVNWIRIEPENNQALELIKKSISFSIKKAPHDMQPREIFGMDIAKSEEELLSEMKSKTRYNINLAQKRGVSVKVISNDKNNKYYVDRFVELVSLTAERKGVSFHPENYYRKMLEIIPGDVLRLYVAEFENKIIAANLVIFYGDKATYLHGAADDEYRNVMAPYLLQWQAILDAKNAGYKFYDFGGVKSYNMDHKAWNNWRGITKFKLGFSPNTKTTEFSGSHDIILNRWKYNVYIFIQKIKEIFKNKHQ